MNFAVMNEPRLITVTRTVTVNKRNKFRPTDKYEFISSEKITVTLYTIWLKRS